jgi:hypothetical protein
MILRRLGQTLSDSLKYLDLNLIVDPNDLKAFLDDFKNVGLSKLLVKNGNPKNIDITFNVLKEFVRENQVKNLAYQVCSRFDPDNPEHLNLDKLITEAHSSIKMIKYNDLIIKVFYGSDNNSF